ncbi:MAG TPA: selenocysteine-specific translation elongation factor, partial [Steroidobacteraceae bacterium]
MIIGTAGHIDHGKTTLVRALTGIDTDRLPEEKARGISIELGYAYSPLAGGEVLGIIDVPGHERLVHTMVAGACGIDFALLVVAADDGVMPQTREHLAIIELLGIARGAVALTKADRVTDGRLRQVEAEIADLLADTTLAGSPIFPLDATQPDDAGTQSLRRHLCEASESVPVRSDRRLFRLAVDRVFTLSGLGTVVTGTVFSGEVRKGDALVVMPSGKATRVRSIHAQNRAAESGNAGQRCALNLAGIETKEVARGDWLADPRAFAPTMRMDVRLRLLAVSGAWSSRRFAAWAPLHVHLATAHQVAHVVPLEEAAISSGESALAQLVFARPICAAPGDRFIVRDAQAMHTVGGGLVLDPYAPARRRRSPERLRWLDGLAAVASGAGVSTLLQCAAHGLAMSDLVRLSGLPSDRLELPRDAHVIETGNQRFVLDCMHWAALRDRVIAALRDFHARAPDEPGADVGRLRRMAAPDLPEALCRSLIGGLIDDRLVARRGPWLRLPDHTAALTAEDQTLALKLQPLIVAGGFDPPWVRDLAVLSCEPEERVRDVLRKTVAQGSVYQVVRDLFYARECVGKLAAIVNRIAEENGGVTAARYRNALGLGRKRTIQILEFFDRVGYTRRV